MKEKLIVYGTAIVLPTIFILLFGFCAAGYLNNISNMVDVIQDFQPATGNIFITCAKIFMHVIGIFYWPFGIVLGWLI